jgi:hypothetical protein
VTALYTIFTNPRRLLEYFRPLIASEMKNDFHHRIISNIKLAFVFCLLCFFTTNIAFGQAAPTGTLKGKLVDSLHRQNVKDATISVFDQSDSSLVAFGLSKQDGSFSVGKIPFGNHYYTISFAGYETISKTFSVWIDNPVIDAGELYLERRAYVLEDVLVKAAPIVIKGDTTEFNAGSFKTIPNATAEDLLKKLPGVEVDKDGSVKSQGETVTRILVDGKRFFGKDPKMATRNLPTDIIDKIQVIDALSEESEFSGFDDGDRVKTINIITKKDKKKGIFGKGSVGVGDDGRYSAGISGNRFNGNQQISLLAQSNNINSQNFSVEDFLGSLTGGNSGSRNRSVNASRGSGTSRGTAANNIFDANAAGISTTTAGGINYNDVWGTKTEVNGSYFYNQVSTLNNRDRYRETFVRNDSSLFNFNHLVSETKNKNHRFNFQLLHNFDSSNSLLIRPTISFQQTGITSEANSTTTRGILKHLNDAVLTGASTNEGINLNNSIMYRHRFGKRGRTISMNFTQDLTTNDRRWNNFSVVTRDWGRQDTADQVSSNMRDGKGLGGTISYTEPLSRSSLLEVSYRYNQNKNTADQETFRRGDISRVYDVVVPNLTNDFENTNVSHRVGLSYRKQLGEWWNYSVGLGVQHAMLTSSNITKNSYVQQSFDNLFPTFNLQYKKSRFKNLRLIYKGVTQQPSVYQLQDVINNTNILHIRAGNPRLVQEFNNSFSLRYNSFSPGRLTNFSVNLSGGFVDNSIVNATTINTTTDSMVVDDYKIVPGAQYTRPVNLDGSFDAGGNIEYSFPVKWLGGNIHLASRFHYNRDVSLVNTDKNFIDDYFLRGIFRINMNLKERFDLNFTSNSTYNIVRYSQQPDRNADYFTQRFAVEPTVSTKSGWLLSNNFEYIINTGQAEGYNLSVPLWNAGIAKLFLKNQQGELRFSVFDLLNQNKSISRNTEQNYVEDIRSQVLNRYFMLSFTYHLRNFKGGKNAGKNNLKRATGNGNSKRVLKN